VNFRGVIHSTAGVCVKGMNSWEEGLQLNLGCWESLEWTGLALQVSKISRVLLDYIGATDGVAGAARGAQSCCRLGCRWSFVHSVYTCGSFLLHLALLPSLPVCPYSGVVLFMSGTCINWMSFCRVT
jgi:hypothetical protein